MHVDVCGDFFKFCSQVCPVSSTSVEGVPVYQFDYSVYLQKHDSISLLLTKTISIQDCLSLFMCGSKIFPHDEKIFSGGFNGGGGGAHPGFLYIRLISTV